ncbi:MAG: WD40 repeat domain-containing protein [Rhizobiaceae bacterium]
MPTIAPLDLDAHCVTAAFIGGNPHFALADGAIHRLDGGHHHAAAHDGLLAAVPALDGFSLITAGEDGKVIRHAADGGAELIADLGRKWVTALATGPQGALAFAAGKDAHVRMPDGKLVTLSHPRTVEGLAFAPKGLRLAVARYNGATLHFPGTGGKPAELEWAGAHTAASFSPDGQFMVTIMQENALHGWKLADARHMRMTGYPAKIKSISWSARGRWLATSGAPASIVWPFQGKDGPMGKAPLELGTRGDSMVTCVACHPDEELVVNGYADGMILAIRITDAKEAVLRRGGNSAISAMAWDAQGRRLAFGSEAGECGVIDIAG